MQDLSIVRHEMKDRFFENQLLTGDKCSWYVLNYKHVFWVIRIFFHGGISSLHRKKIFNDQDKVVIDIRFGIIFFEVDMLLRLCLIKNTYTMEEQVNMVLKLIHVESWKMCHSNKCCEN